MYYTVTQIQFDCFIAMIISLYSFTIVASLLSLFFWRYVTYVVFLSVLAPVFLFLLCCVCVFFNNNKYIHTWRRPKGWNSWEIIVSLLFIFINTWVQNTLFVGLFISHLMHSHHCSLATNTAQDIGTTTKKYKKTTHQINLNDGCSPMFPRESRGVMSTRLSTINKILTTKPAK